MDKPEQPIDAQKLTKEIIEAEAELRAMGNTPKSETEPPNCKTCGNADESCKTIERKYWSGVYPCDKYEPNTELGKDTTLIRN